MASTYPETAGSNRTVRLLAALSAYALVAVGALVLADLPTLLRIPLALPVLLFAPGYALVAALFPRSERLTSGGAYRTARSRGETADEFTFLERAVLAVVCSVAVVPLVAVALTPVVGVDPSLVLAGVAVFTLLASVVAVVRSGPGPNVASPERSLRDRFAVTVPTDAVTLAAFSLAALLLVSSAAVALTGGGGDALETEFYVAGGSPDAAVDAAPDGAVTYHLRVEHHADRTQAYTVVVRRSKGDAGELGRTALTVGPDETATPSVQLSPAALEPGATLQFALYTGDPSDAENPHRTLRLATNATGAT